MKRVLLAALVALAGCDDAPEGKNITQPRAMAENADPCRTGKPLECRKRQMILAFRPADPHLRRMAEGRTALLRKVGQSPEELEARYGSVERGLIALGCKDQAPGVLAAVYRSGDGERDYWCARKIAGGSEPSIAPPEMLQPAALR